MFEVPNPERLRYFYRTMIGRVPRCLEVTWHVPAHLLSLLD